MDTATETAQARWEARPTAALAARALLVAVPLVLGVVAALVTRAVLPEPDGSFDWLATWFAATAVATLAAAVGLRLARPLRRLADLVGLALAFPPGTPAPSRLRAALGRTDGPLALVAALDRHDRRLRGHGERVRAYAHLIADELGFDETKLERLEWAALLHDVGKLSIPAQLLAGRGGLSDEVTPLMEAHPAEGRTRLGDVGGDLDAWLGEWAAAVDEHHERWDGGGYPNGLAGEEIGIAARIVAVADAFDVLTSPHTYKRRIGVADAFEELEANAGSQFDPTVVRALLNVDPRRLRAVMGAAAWFTNGPLLRPVPLAPVGATALGALAAVAVLAGGALVDTDPGGSSPAAAAGERPRGSTVIATSGGPAAFEAAGPRSAEVTTTSTTSTSTTTTTAPPTTTTTAPLGAGGALGSGAGNAPVAPPTGGGGTAPPPADIVPVVRDEAVVLLEDSTILADVLRNDQAVALVGVGQPLVGSAAVEAGSVRYTPPPDWFGTVHVHYLVRSPAGPHLGGTLHVAVLPVPDDPRAADDVAVAFEDQPLVFDPLANDLDPDWEPITLAGVGAPALGTATATTERLVTYVPPADRSGDDAFTYDIVDPTGRRATATVAVAVVPVNDAPVVEVGALPVADEADGAVVLAGWLRAAPGPLDEAGQRLSVAVTVDDPSLFAAPPTVDLATGTLRYTPAPGADGTTRLAVTVTDDGGTEHGGVDATTVERTLTVRSERGPVPVDDAVTLPEDASPVLLDVLANDSSRGTGPLRLVGVQAGNLGLATAVAVGDRVLVTPDRNEHGTGTFTYTVADASGLTRTATVTVTITPVADDPTATDDGFTTTAGTTLTVDAPGVLANDGDHDGDPVAVQAVVDPPDHGTVTVRRDGGLTYAPAPGFTGTDRFTYRVSDGTGRRATAEVTIRVTATPATSMGLYLGSGAAGASVWGMSTVAPPGGSVELDHDADGDPGLTVRKSFQDLLVGAQGEYHDWIHDPAGTLVLDGPVTLELWSSTAGFDPAKAVDWSVGLYDCQLGGGGCVAVATRREVHVQGWNGGDPRWVRRDLHLGHVSHTVEPGHQLRVRVMVGHEPIWVALGGARPSRLVVTTP